ncbi:amidohydrolase [Oceanicoccus sagamiensis]|uniref:Amidohydrolase n=1 Tax=Oceanicoccus sagamiensis TaxID=716816 RepID=A0A1X9NCH8_9GAMM|nr:amidohydrolase [Oceanicoccus sagamiensis]ARN72677.1 amidohydrolase [Oceanicoccus sagamiensis]
MKPINLLVVLLVLGLGVLLQSCNSDKPSDIKAKADHLYTGATIFTSNPEAPWAQAMAVKGDRILFTGAREEADDFIHANTTIHNLNNQLILPGFIDAHAHPGSIALNNQLISLPEAESLTAQMADIAELLETHADLPVIYAIGWENNFFGIEGPDRKVLDQLDASRPILIFDSTMHSLWVNSKALDMSGIGDNPEDPVPNFSYYQRDKNGQLTGYITESAASLFLTRFFTMGNKETAVLQSFLNYLSERGVTTLFDAGNFGLDDEVYQAVSQLEQQGLLPLRYHGSYTLYLPQQLPTAIAELKRLGERYNSEKIRIDTLKIFYDGVIETRTAHLLEDYIDTPGNRGESLFSEQALYQLLLELDQERINVHIHALGDQSSNTVLNAVEQARNTLGRPLAIQVTITHLHIVDPADFKRYQALEVIANFTPAWHGYDDAYYAEALGERAYHPYPAGALLEQGATINFSSDVYFPSEWEDGSASPFMGIQVGHTRQYSWDKPDSKPSGPVTEQLSLETMVQGYTLNGAKQLSRQNSLGSLQAGKKADFIVLEKNLFTMDKYAIHQVLPKAVVVDGQLIHGTL